MFDTTDLASGNHACDTIDLTMCVEIWGLIYNPTKLSLEKPLTYSPIYGIILPQ